MHTSIHLFERVDLSPSNLQTTGDRDLEKRVCLQNLTATHQHQMIKTTVQADTISLHPAAAQYALWFACQSAHKILNLEERKAPLQYNTGMMLPRRKPPSSKSINPTLSTLLSVVAVNLGSVVSMSGRLPTAVRTDSKRAGFA